MAGGPLQAADDMIRIITNGVTFGLADKGVHAITGDDEAAKTAAARERAGIAGDLASVLGYGGGAKALFTGGKAAIKAVPAIARSIMSKKAGLAAGLGLGGLVEYNARTTPEAAPARLPGAVPSAAQVKAPRSSPADNITDKVMSALEPYAAAIDNQPPSFADMARQVAQSQGGISMRQLGGIAEVAQRTAPKPVKPVNPAYETAQRLQNIYMGEYNAAIAAGVPQAEADRKFRSDLEGLMKLSATDSLIRGAPSYDDNEGN